MKYLIIAGLFMATSALAQDVPKLELLTTPNSITLMPLPHAVTLSSGGRSATIDFGGDAVTYSGDLPVDDAAKVFFEAVMRMRKDCLK